MNDPIILPDLADMRDEALRQLERLRAQIADCERTRDIKASEWEQAKSVTGRAEFDDRSTSQKQAAFIEYQKTAQPSDLRNKHLSRLPRMKLATVNALADARAKERDAKEAFEKSAQDIAFAQNQYAQKEQEYNSIVADIGKLTSGENDSPTYN